jgi:hypothetical protein
MHLKQSPFCISSSILGSGFGILGFFHEGTGDVGRGVEVRAGGVLSAGRAAGAAGARAADREFNSVSLTSARMQMSANSFKSVV